MVIAEGDTSQRRVSLCAFVLIEQSRTGITQGMAGNLRVQNQVPKARVGRVRVTSRGGGSAPALGGSRRRQVWTDADRCGRLNISWGRDVGFREWRQLRL